MKTTYIFTLILTIINFLLVITNTFLIYIDIFSGFILLIILGLYQILMSIIYLILWKKMSKKLRIPFIIYGVLATATIILMISGGEKFYIGIDLANFSIYTGTILSLYFLVLSILQTTFLKLKL